MRKDRIPGLVSIILAIAAVAALTLRQGANVDWHMQWPTWHRAPSDAAPQFASDFASSATDRFVHAASVAALPDGRLLSVWFGGSREGAGDVNIFGAFYDPAARRWGEERVLATTRGTGLALQRFVRKLGNPVVSQAPDGKLWLFYVSVSMGGWAGSALNASHSLDGGASWSAPRRLITSPFFNISTLVKGTPFYYRDGSIGLPVYHEFLGKFAELLRLDGDGNVLDKARISHGKHSLQPVIVASGPADAVALMRYAGEHPKRLLTSHTRDGGRHWQRPGKVAVANSNAAVAAVRMPNGAILGVMNDLDDGRHRLSLLVSRDDGDSWQRLTELEDSADFGGDRVPRQTYTPALQQKMLHSSSRSPSLWARYRAKLDRRVCSDSGCRFVFDYPFMIQAPDGEYHIVYSWNKSFIKHVRFNQAWVDTL